MNLIFETRKAAQFIYYDSKLLEPAFYFAKLVWTFL